MRKAIILLFCIYSSIAIADTSADAYKSLKGIGSSFEVGVPYTEFMSLLREAKLNVTLLNEERSGKMSTFASSLNSALDNYERVGEYFKLKNESDKKYVSENSTLVDKFYKKYPDVK